MDRKSWQIPVLEKNYFVWKDEVSAEDAKEAKCQKNRQKEHQASNDSNSIKRFYGSRQNKNYEVQLI